MGYEVHHPEGGKQRAVKLFQELLLLVRSPLLRKLVWGAFDGRASMMNHC